MNIRDYLNILRIDSSATDKELQRAYRNGVKKWHPDRHQQASEAVREEAERHMRELNEAFDALSRIYKRDGRLPDPDEPIRSEPFHAARPATTTPWQAAAPQSRATKSESTAQQEERVAPRKKKSQGGLWLMLVVVAVVASYLFGDYLFDAEQVYESHKQVAPGQTDASRPVTSEALPINGGVENSPPPAQVLLGQPADSTTTEEPRKSAFETRSLFTREEPATQDEVYFTYGDTLGKVYEVQGVPNRTEGDVWYYGSSEVHFSDGRVVSWVSNATAPLRARHQARKKQ